MTSARSRLVQIYTATLETLHTLPESSIYRQATTAITQDRLTLIEKTASDELVAKALGVTRIEWVVKDAEAEWALAKNVLEWKMYPCCFFCFSCISHSGFCLVGNR